MNFLRRQLIEIASDAALRRYGAALALINVLTGVFWITVQPLRHILSARTPAICWPFFENCEQVRASSSEQITGLLLLLVIVAVVNAALFLAPRTVPAAWGLLLFTTLVKIGVLSLDFRLILNQHYMAVWATLVFLFLPHKRLTVPVLIICFYVWAGLLKLNAEWLSGAALYGRRPFGMPEEFVQAACVYVICLELFVVFGLLARRPGVFWASFAQIVLFHVASFWVVGFYYPMLMFLILSLLVLKRTTPEGIAGAGMSRTQGRTVACAIVVIFSLAQIVPRAFPGNPAITGEGRVFALNMFDAPIACEGTATFRGAKGTKTVRIGAPFLQPRIHCDPILYLGIARNMCRDNHVVRSLGDFDLRLETWPASTRSRQVVVAIPAFCAAKVSYSMVRHNSWIQLEQAVGSGSTATPALRAP